MNVVSAGELLGGKIGAGLSRQHPRDIFDIREIFEHGGITEESKNRFIYNLLSDKRDFIDLLNPNRLDQSESIKSAFDGMSEKEFSYKEFEDVRDKLITTINKSLTKNDKEFIVSFAEASPDCDKFSSWELKTLPSIEWKLHNLKKIKDKNPVKHTQIVIGLKEHFGMSIKGKPTDA